MHLLSTLFFAAVLFGTGFCVGYTVRANLPAVLCALRGEWEGPRS